MLKSGKFGICRALGDLAKPLELAGQLEEALAFTQQALTYRAEHEGPEAWWTHRNCHELSKLLQMIGSQAKACNS